MVHPDCALATLICGRYARILDRIIIQAASTRAEKAHRLLAWIVCATRPLTWLEIQAAVSFDGDAQKLDHVGRRFVVDAKDVCGSLVEIFSDEVTLVHSTAKQ